MLGPFSQSGFDPRKGLLTPSSYRCGRFVRDLFEWGRRDGALTALQLHHWILDLGQDFGEFGNIRVRSVSTS